MLTDEIYEHLTYGDTKSTSMPVAVPELADRCIVVNGVAKTYAMTGWRVGWMIGPKDVVKAATNLQSHQTSNVSNVAQRAAIAALTGDLTAVDEMREAFDRRRQTMVRMLNEIPGVECPEPTGAFYAYPSVKGVLGKRDRRPHADHVGRAGRADPRRGRGRGRAGRGVRGPGLPAAVLRARRRRPGRGRRPDAEAARLSGSRRRPAGRLGATTRRDLQALPKAHLHLHFTGSMRHATLVELADRTGSCCPTPWSTDWPPQLSAADERGWFRFQRLYDIARSVLRTEDDVRRLVREAAEDDVADGGRWLEIQVDPSGYAARFGGITAFTDLVLDAVREASRDTGLGIAVVIAANRTRHPLDARTLARLAAQYAGRGVVGFGLSNDERRGTTSEFAPAFRIAERAGLLLAPHGGELLGPASVRTCLDELDAGRIGHGVRVVEDPALLERVVGAGRAARGLPGLERLARRLQRPDDGAAAGAARGRRTVALGADDPLLFGSRLAVAVRHHARRPRPVRRRPSRSWRGCPSARRAPRTTCGRRRWPTSTPGSPARSRLGA